ncbi:lactonase family protein [Pseudolysinimonas kribbensis]|nr:beta-propeller fold lactonase family protein [Pseudolysinimonas kribbensis]
MELLIGTYTERKAFVDGHAPGLLAATWEAPASGERRIGEARLAAKSVNPSWVARTRDGARVYCTAELENGRVVGFARGDAGTLTALGEQDSHGADPAHLGLDADERLLAVANYSGGTIAILPLDADGRPGAATSVHTQPAPVVPTGRAEQESAHPHHVEFDPVTGQLLVADLGLDRVCVFDVTGDGVLEPRPERDVVLPPGTGPRQLAFDETQSRLFVIGELGNTVHELRRTAGGFQVHGGIGTLPPGEAGDGDSGAALLYSAAHSRLYATTRGRDTVTIIDTSGPELARVAVIPSGGRTPRGATLTPDGRLIVAHQDDDAVVVFDLDPDGMPVPADRTTIASPVCLVGFY